MADKPIVVTNLQPAGVKLKMMQRPGRGRGAPKAPVSEERKRLAANAIKVFKLAKEQQQEQARVD